jgi:hypothetical protein
MEDALGRGHLTIDLDKGLLTSDETAAAKARRSRVFPIRGSALRNIGFVDVSGKATAGRKRDGGQEQEDPEFIHFPRSLYLSLLKLLTHDLDLVAGAKTAGITELW